MKFRAKIKKQLIIISMLIAFGAIIIGCNAQRAVIADGPLAPTVAVIGEEDGTQIGVTAEGETQYHFDKYGPLGKEVWEEIAFQWTTYALNTEDELRIIMDATYGNQSTKEELTQDILALPRNEHNEGLSAEPSQAQAQAQESKPSTQAPKPTQPQETKPAPQQQQTQTQQQQQPQEQAPQQTPPQQNNGLIPGTDIPSTGNPTVDAALAESYQRQKDSFSGSQTTPGDYSNKTIDQGEGLTWN